jgi:UDP-glucuronate 4-epimerase
VAKILVTGSAGFIGYHATKALLENSDLEIVALDSMEPITPTKLTEIRIRKLAKLGISVNKYNLESSDISALQRKFGKFELILHLAAYPGVRISPKEESVILRNNQISFEIISNYASNIGSKLIYASSSSVYGDMGMSSSVKEEDLVKFHAKGAYALSKLENEKYALELAKLRNLQSIGLRFFSVFGNYGREDMAYFKFANKYASKLPITIYDSFKDERDYTPVNFVINDVIELIDLFILGDLKISENFFSPGKSPFLNIGTGSPRTLQSLIDFYTQYFNYEPKIIIKNRNYVESRKTWSNNEKRNRIFKPRPSLNFNEYLVDFLSWFDVYMRGGYD